MPSYRLLKVHILNHDGTTDSDIALRDPRSVRPPIQCQRQEATASVRLHGSHSPVRSNSADTIRTHTPLAWSRTMPPIRSWPPVRLHNCRHVALAHGTWRGRSTRPRPWDAFSGRCLDAAPPSPQSVFAIAPAVSTMRFEKPTHYRTTTRRGPACLPAPRLEAIDRRGSR